MTTTIAWLDGQWGTAHGLQLPLSDRGLQLSDGLFETVLVLDGQPKLLNDHLNRWQDGAVLLGMDPPPTAAWLEPLIEQAIQRLGLTEGQGALRLNWSRGDSSGRGIDTTGAETHRFWLTLQACKPVYGAIRTIVSRLEQRNAESQLSRCKTLAYGQAIQARREAKQAGAEDALLRNNHGQLCCGTTANLLVQRGGEWLTPPIQSGCLPGVMRAKALARGFCREAWLGTNLNSGDHALLINSLGCRTIQSVDGIPLQQGEDPRASGDSIWRQLLS